MASNKTQKYLDLIDKVVKQKDLDLSSGEDLSIGIMNLISIEEHLFYTSQKTKKKKYMELLNEIRVMRTELLKDIIKDYEGEVWCLSKHLLAASMRIYEVGTKELKKGGKKKAWDLFEKSYKLYSLFWGLNLGVVEMDKVAPKKQDKSVFSKLGAIVQKAIDCCRE